MRIRLLFLGVLAMTACLGQEFEVVSIKPNKTLSGSSGSHTNQGMLRGTNLSLKSLIVSAYGIRRYQLEGPDWLDSERFDISAKFPENFPKEREKYAAAYQAMLQKMLADRFKVSVHREQKSMGVFALVIGKNGVKFKEAAADHSSSNSNNTHYVGTSIGMDDFAAFLSGQMELPVLNQTGLKARYDLTLDWITERQTKADTELQAGQPIQEAIQDQLGLKVEHRKAPIDVVVVDHAEKIPTEN